MHFRKKSWAAVAAAVVLSGLPAGLAHAIAQTARSGQAPAAAPVSVAGWAGGQPVRVTPGGRTVRAAPRQPPGRTAVMPAERTSDSLPPSALADITAGPDNGVCPGLCQPGPGYDDVTGLGSPRAGIEAALAAAAARS